LIGVTVDEDFEKDASGGRLPVGAGSIHTAALFEAAGVAAPVAAAGFAVPFGHTFPFFSIGVHDETRVDGALERWSDEPMNDWNHIAGAALRAYGKFLGGRRFGSRSGWAS
jgi:hypothetical protein